MIESPFPSHHAFVDGCLVHYVDEGAGVPIVLLHGVPVWSYVYRHLIRELRSDLRCIAPDLPGFGLSLARPDFGFAPQDHEIVLSALIEHLNLDRILIMGHDWGGPLGLRMALRHPDRVAGMVLGNTWAWPQHSVTTGNGWQTRLLTAAISQARVRTSKSFWRFGLRYAKPAVRLPAEIEHSYLAPFPTAESRRPPAELVRHNLLNATGRSTYMKDLEHDLGSLRDLPVLLTWGARCPAFRTAERERFETIFPNHRSVVFPRAGHFVHEDEPLLVAAAIREWMTDQRIAGGRPVRSATT